MTSTTVDTEYKLNEDKTTFTKVYMMVNSQRRLAFENLLSHGCEWFGVYNIFSTGDLEFFEVNRISNAHTRRVLPKEKPFGQRRSMLTFKCYE